MKIYLHINYFEQACGLESAFRMTQEIGADGLEVRRIPHVRHREHGTDYLDQLVRLWDKYPVEALSFGAPGPNLTLESEAERERELEAACVFYERAFAALPVRVVNLLLGEILNPDKDIHPTRFSLQGSALSSSVQWEWAKGGGRVLADLATVHGVKLAVETHGIYLHDSVEAACRLVEMVDRPATFGTLWDHSNEFLFDEPPDMEKSLRRCRDTLFYVHLKNLVTYNGGGYRICGLSEGRINTRRQLEALRDSGFAGPIAIECPREGDRIRFLEEDFLYIKALLDDVQFPASQKESASC